jgi:hypothetical protein
VVAPSRVDAVERRLERMNVGRGPGDNELPRIRRVVGRVARDPRPLLQLVEQLVPAPILRDIHDYCGHEPARIRAADLKQKDPPSGRAFLNQVTSQDDRDMVGFPSTDLALPIGGRVLDQDGAQTPSAKGRAGVGFAAVAV